MRKRERVGRQTVDAWEGRRHSVRNIISERWSLGKRSGAGVGKKQYRPQNKIQASTGDRYGLKTT